MLGQDALKCLFQSKCRVLPLEVTCEMGEEEIKWTLNAPRLDFMACQLSKAPESPIPDGIQDRNNSSHLNSYLLLPAPPPLSPFSHGIAQNSPPEQQSTNCYTSQMTFSYGTRPLKFNTANCSLTSVFQFLPWQWMPKHFSFLTDWNWGSRFRSLHNQSGRVKQSKAKQTVRVFSPHPPPLWFKTY